MVNDWKSGKTQPQSQLQPQTFSQSSHQYPNQPQQAQHAHIYQQQPQSFQTAVQAYQPYQQPNRQPQQPFSVTMNFGS